MAKSKLSLDELEATVNNLRKQRDAHIGVYKPITPKPPRPYKLAQPGKPSRVPSR